jgi:hypothetical protein
MTIEMNYSFSDCVYFDESRRIFVFRDGSEMTIGELVASQTYVEVSYIWTSHDIDRAHRDRNTIRNMIRDYVSLTLGPVPKMPKDLGMNMLADIAHSSKINERVGKVRKAQRLVGPDKF